MNTSVYSVDDQRFSTGSVDFDTLGRDETKFTITKPVRVGLFKLDKHRQIQPCNNLTTPQKLNFSNRNSSSKSKSPFPLKSLETPFDLNTGFDYYIKKKTAHDLPEGLKNLLLYADENKNLYDNVNIITWRGILTRLASACYLTDKDRPEIFGAVRKSGKLHLFHPSTKEKIEEKLPIFLEKFCYQGRAFEKYVNRDPPTPNSPVDENLEEVAVFNTKIGKFKVLYGAEMDGDNLEIKTTGFVAHDGHKISLLKKSQKWWAQCFLVGVENLLIGYRTRNGFVYEVSEINTKLLVKSAI